MDTEFQRERILKRIEECENEKQSVMYIGFY